MLWCPSAGVEGRAVPRVTKKPSLQRECSSPISCVSPGGERELQLQNALAECSDSETCLEEQGKYSDRQRPHIRL